VDSATPQKHIYTLTGKFPGVWEHVSDPRKYCRTKCPLQDCSTAGLACSRGYTLCAGAKNPLHTRDPNACQVHVMPAAANSDHRPHASRELVCVFMNPCDGRCQCRSQLYGGVRNETPGQGAAYALWPHPHHLAIHCQEPGGQGVGTQRLWALGLGAFLGGGPLERSCGSAAGPYGSL